MTTAPEHHPRVLAVVSKDIYQKARQDYPDRVHHEILRRKNRENIPFIYGLCGPVGEEKGKKVLLPLESIPSPLEALLQNAELKKESSRPWNAPSEDELSWVPGAEAEEWMVYDFKVVHYQTSAYDFVRDVLGTNPYGPVSLWPEGLNYPQPLFHYQRFWPVENVVAAGILQEEPRPDSWVYFLPKGYEEGIPLDPKIVKMNETSFPLKKELAKARPIVFNVAYDEQVKRYRPHEIRLIPHHKEGELFQRIMAASVKEENEGGGSNDSSIEYILTVDAAKLPELGYYEGDEQKRYLTISVSNSINKYSVTKNNVDLVVIAFLDEHKWHQEPMFEHTEGEGWRASGGGGSCW